MRIKSQLRFNLNNKSKQDQKALINEHVITPLLNVAKKNLRKKVRTFKSSNNQIVDMDLIILGQRELVTILKKYDSVIANDIYLAITKEKQLSSIEL